jgi:PEP-CTERM/exosortase A-associated glycosyltransferase
MRILHILHRSVPGTHGYAIRSREIVTKQLARGLEPLVVTSPSQAPLGPLDAQGSEYIDGVRYFRSCDRILEPTQEVSDESAVRSAVRVVQNLRMLTTVSRVARAYRPAVIHAHSPFTCGLVGTAVGRAHGIPTVYEVRGMWEETHAARHAVRGKSLRYRIVRALEGLAIRRADACCVIGEALKLEVLRRGISQDRVIVVPNGVDLTAFVPAAPKPAVVRQLGLHDATVMGYIGSFSQYERLDLLMEAMIALAPEFPALRLLLVGDGDAMKELQCMATEAGVSDRVVFTGRVDHDRVRDFYRLCNFLVLPRSDAGKMSIVTPLKPLEIMAMGKALIASDIEGHREIVQDGVNGVLFQADTVKDLVAKCQAFVIGKESAVELGVRAREWVKLNRDWDVLANRYVDLYRRLVYRRGQPDSPHCHCEE